MKSLRRLNEPVLDLTEVVMAAKQTRVRQTEDLNYSLRIGKLNIMVNGRNGNVLHPNRITHYLVVNYDGITIGHYRAYGERGVVPKVTYWRPLEIKQRVSEEEREKALGEARELIFDREEKEIERLESRRKRKKKEAVE